MKMFLKFSQRFGQPFWIRAFSLKACGFHIGYIWGTYTVGIIYEVSTKSEKIFRAERNELQNEARNKLNFSECLFLRGIFNGYIPRNL